MKTNHVIPLILVAPVVIMWVCIVLAFTVQAVREILRIR